MATMQRRRTLQDLVRDAGIPILDRQPCLPVPTQPVAVASDDDHVSARRLLVERRKQNPDYRDPSKQLRGIFRTSKEKEKLQDTNAWVFSQDELDQALSGVIDQPATHPGLVQAFLNLGANVNFVDTLDAKSKGHRKSIASARRRSTVLQQAATLRRADSVSLLASSGADQTTLDEGLKAALASNDHSSVQELLRHGANLNNFPNALSDAVRANDQDFVRLLLRAPKALRADVISSCLPAAVQHKSESILLLLIGHGADPNFDSAGALGMAISQQDYRLALVLLTGPIPLSPSSLQTLLEPVLRLSKAEELYGYLQLLLCCGLSPALPELARLLVAATRQNDSTMARLLINHGVPTSYNQAECLKVSIANSNWKLADDILGTPVSSAHASAAVDAIPDETFASERLHILSALVAKGAGGSPLDRWLVRAVEDGDSALIELLMNVGTSIKLGNNTAIQAAVARKDTRSLRMLLQSQPSPQTLAALFPRIHSGYTVSERLEIVRLLLKHGARGPEVDQALVDAVADTTSSRNTALIVELVGHGASISHDNGKAISLAVAQADLPILHLLCNAKPSSKVSSSALPFSFGSNGLRHSATLPMIELLLAYGIEEEPAIQTLEKAIKGGYANLDIIQRLVAAEERLLEPAFQKSIALRTAEKKVSLLKWLLSKGISQQVIDQALVAETHLVATGNNATVVQLLLSYGASLNYDDGAAFNTGVASGNARLVGLLLGGNDKPARLTVTKAFRALFDTYSSEARPESSPNVDIVRELLSRGVGQSDIDRALQTVLDPTNSVENFELLIDLLLSHNADVNTSDGVCFVFSAQRNSKVVFQKLLQCQPDFGRVVPTLIGAGLEEETLTELLQLCFAHGCTSDQLDVSHQLHKLPTILQAIQTYPRSKNLVQMLLAHGCNPEVTALGVADVAIGDEALPALVWALAQPQKLVSGSVLLALLERGASPTRTSSESEIAPIALAAREGRQDIVQTLLDRGADPSIRDKWNRSALFHASSASVPSIVQALAAHALKNDGSLHEAARALQFDGALILINHGHNPNFPSRLHGGRNALGELCLRATVTNGSQRTKARQLVRLFLDHGANAKFKSRNERSSVILALDNPHSPLDLTEALLETEVWEDLNDEKHLFHDSSRLAYSPIKYVELVASHSRAQCKRDLVELLRDKGCEPKYYAEGADQPEGAIGMPETVARLVDRQKEHQLSLKIAKETSENNRMLEEAAHRDLLRRKREQQEAELNAVSVSAAQHQKLEQQKHEAEVSRVRSAERMKRSERVAWHNLAQEQERDTAAQRRQIEERKASASLAHEAKLIAARKDETEHRVAIERIALKEKEELYERNVKRQLQITQRVDESAQLHARLRQDRPAIEGAQWGTVD